MLLLALAIVCVVALIPRDLAGPERAGIFGKDGMIAGVVLLARSPYLAGICLYLFFHTLGGTIFYFEQAHIVSEALETRADRTGFFAWVDFAVNGITLTLQLTVAGLTLSRLGLGIGLSILPLVTLGGLSWLAVSPTLVAIGVLQVLRRAANYAISRPAREVLYTVVSRDEKYKTKPFIDTFVYRGGDVIGAWGFDSLTAAGLGVSMIALVTTPIPILWVVLSLLLGIAHSRRRA
jgi:AAA family ATP:ADP antiporter